MRSRRPPFALWPLVPSITGRTFVEVGLGRRAMLPPAPRLADRGVGGGKWGAPLRGRREARFVVASHATWQSGRGGGGARRASFARRPPSKLREPLHDPPKAHAAAAGFVDEGGWPSPRVWPAKFAHASGRRPRAPERVGDHPQSPAEVARSCPFLPAGSGPLPKSSQRRVTPAPGSARGFLVAGRLATLGLGHAPALGPGEQRAPSANQRSQTLGFGHPFRIVRMFSPGTLAPATILKNRHFAPRALGAGSSPTRW